MSCSSVEVAYPAGGLGGGKLGGAGGLTVGAVAGGLGMPTCRRIYVPFGAAAEFRLKLASWSESQLTSVSVVCPRVKLFFADDSIGDKGKKDESEEIDESKPAERLLSLSASIEPPRFNESGFIVVSFCPPIMNELSVPISRIAFGNSFADLVP
mmetsp:Transcript_11845/g.14379  ORF Transcript_11845/g.14379 Transcript_11845/m.14379 type:complete len:154 (+) Transcript_11845:231-692(+)|eukprot:CAMPEP_0184008028 /NCGR_PEP_ID=MMETSP0954-20121128/1709_1 /TAXON_ID=627963 /ORGANISM="Aplanochytrium sp, Strain PBS07" /LENGTH=153 /DNA_ID=CAMNT_0026287019 /DNA_START=463 /DNA_END=924 /DNA_ORIENTATION=-